VDAESPKDLNRIIHGTLFGDAVNQASVAALLATDDGQYVAANDEACRLTGYSRTELVTFRTGQLGADDTSRQIYEAITRRQELEGIKTVRRRDGKLVRCRYQAVPTRVARTPHYLLMLRPSTGATAGGRDQ
jgi:PAS domain S-box-containing protein